MSLPLPKKTKNQIVVSLGATEINVNPVGMTTIVFPKQHNERYTFQKVTCRVRNLILGQPRVDIVRRSLFFFLLLPVVPTEKYILFVFLVMLTKICIYCVCDADRDIYYSFAMLTEVDAICLGC